MTGEYVADNRGDGAGWLCDQHQPRNRRMREVVCAACLTEACAAGTLMCEDARKAALVMRERACGCGDAS